MVSITRVRDRHGDFVFHAGGCSDIGRKGNHDAETYSGETIIDAIVAADTDMALWFGETAYTESAQENGCWTVAVCSPAPCFGPLVRGVTFDRNSGRPSR